MKRAAIPCLLILGVLVGSCAKKVPPATRTAPTPPVTQSPQVTEAPSRAPQRVEAGLPAPLPALAEDAIGNRTLDDLNRESPLRPAFFPLDSSELDDAGRAVVGANAELLKKYQTWTITIEGHCDERGTAEYNLALGERRAVNVRAYLLSLGIAPNRVRTVSYGKEFPFDPGHTEAAWSKNRRGHFVITAK
ncbi:MAG: OmpA family protein [Vicinamibacterales bacterium]